MHQDWRPVAISERYAVLDLTRGLALFGVLLVNLLYFFRVSLFAHMLDEQTGVLDVLIARLIEFKAFDLFSMSFGIGMAVQAGRARAVSVPLFLTRRFLVLLLFGALHMTLVSNVDILMLYAVCGLVAIPFIRLPAVVLTILGAAAVYLPSVLPGSSFPNPASLRAHASEATRIYGTADYATVLQFRWQETVRLIFPLLIGVAQKTFGLILIGIAIWRSGVVRDPARHRRLLWVLAAFGVAIGLLGNQHVALAIGYGALLLAASPTGRWTVPFVAAGRMAFTNYLTQSLVFAIVFYGFGMIGRLPLAPVAAAGVVFYSAQLAFSVWWLRRHRFGPFEWIWRSFTYGRRM